MLVEMGALMYGSHASYTACGLASDGTDLFVELVRERGQSSGLYGAKITGGGSGGTVAILGRADAGSGFESRCAPLLWPHRPLGGYFRGSSPGAFSSPVVEVTI